MKIMHVPEHSTITASGGDVAVGIILEPGDDMASVMAVALESPEITKIAMAAANKAGVISPGLNMPSREYPLPVNDRWQSIVNSQMVSYGRPYAYLTKVKIRSGGR